MGKSHYNAGNTLSFPAGADLSTSQYLCIKTDGSGNVVLATSATDPILGTVKIPASQYDTVEIFGRNSSGTILAIAGGVVNPNDMVTANSSSQVITTTSTGNQIVGMYVGSAAAATGQIIEIVPFTGKY